MEREREREREREERERERKRRGKPESPVDNCMNSNVQVAGKMPMNAKPRPALT